MIIIPMCILIDNILEFLADKKITLVDSVVSDGGGYLLKKLPTEPAVAKRAISDGITMRFESIGLDMPIVILEPRQELSSIVDMVVCELTSRGFKNIKFKLGS